MTPQHAATLRAFLEDPRHTPETLSYHELQGFLFTLASAPQLVMPSDWLPEVFCTASIFDSIEDEQRVTAAVMALYNDIHRCVSAVRPTLPGDCVFREPPLDNFEDAAPMAQWCEGFLFGHEWLQDLWNDTLPTALASELAACVLSLGFFASQLEAEDVCAQLPEHDLAVVSAMVIDVFPEAVATYAVIGRSIRGVLSERQPQRLPH